MPSPEYDLLACSIRRHVDADGARAEAERLVGERRVDWERLVRGSLRQGVLPALHRLASTLPPELVPPEARTQLETYSFESTARNLHMARVQREVLATLEDEGLRAMPLKGLPLAARCYGGLSERKAGDLDLLVDRRAVPRAVELLGGLGFVLEDPTLDLSRYVADPRNYHVRLAHRTEGETWMEVHWTLYAPRPSFPLEGPAMTPEAVWAHAERIACGDHEVWSPGREDLLLFLCLHGTKHRWPRLYHVEDVAALLGTDPPDWDVVTERAASMRGVAIVTPALHLVRMLEAAPVPPEVYDRLVQVEDDRSLVPLLRRPHELFSLELGELGTGGDALAATRVRLLMHLRMQPNGRARLGVLARVLFTPNRRDRAFLPLPRPLAFLYPLVRLARLARHGLRFLTARLF